MKVRAVLCPDHTDDKKFSILSRAVRWTEDCLLYDAGPRHVEKFLRDMGIGGCKSFRSPGIKPTADAVEEESVLLQGDVGCGQVQSLSVDWFDIIFASKEMFRAMSGPFEAYMFVLQYVGRYLEGRPHIAQREKVRGGQVQRETEKSIDPERDRGG